MNRRVANLAATAMTLTFAGCAGAMGHAPPIGGIFAGAKGVAPFTQAEVTDGARPGPLQGKACAMGVLGIASWGDMSLDAAKKSAGIQQVATMDYKTTDILGIVFQKHCTIISGSPEAIPEIPAAPAPAPDTWSTPEPAAAPANPAPVAAPPPPPGQ